MVPKVLIVEDEKLIRWSLRQKLESHGLHVKEVDHGQAALQAVTDDSFDLVLLDYKLPDMNGVQILRQIRDRDKHVVVIMMTAYYTIDSAVEAMKLGAHDYITKPFDMDLLLHNIEKALETTKLRREVAELRKHLTDEYGIERIIGRAPCMMELFDTIRRVAASSASTIFLRGESGTGKDMVARVIHHASDRAAGPFMNITCTSISESLLESELFGHERGAFTDARSQKKGLFELADGGTIFLDEIGDMPMGLQAKLLRFLEEKTFRRVGGTTEIKVDVRIISATNRDIDQAVTDRAFRADLLYRLNVIPIVLPPLRDRGDDIKLLAKHFVARFSQEFKRPMLQIEDNALEVLLRYRWPGNVRELRNVMERAVLLCMSDVIRVHDIVTGLPGISAMTDARGSGFVLPATGIDLHELENDFVRQALERTNNNQTHAAKLLGISRDSLRYRMDKLGLL